MMVNTHLTCVATFKRLKSAKYNLSTNKNNHLPMVIFYSQSSFYGIIITETVDVSASSWFQGGDSVSVYEALSLMIAFGTLIAIIVLSR